MTTVKSAIFASFLLGFVQTGSSQEALSELAKSETKTSSQEKENSEAWMPENFHNKTIVLNYDQAIFYSLSKGDGGWHRFDKNADSSSKTTYPQEIVFKDTDSTSIKWRQPTFVGDFSIKKLKDNSFALVNCPEVDDEKDIMCDEYVSCYQFSLTAKNEGIACFSSSSYAGTTFITNIKFTIKNN